MRIKNIKLITIATLTAGIAMGAGLFLRGSASATAVTCPATNQVTSASAISVSGTTGSVTFTVAPGCHNVKLSFVSYTAPASTFSAATADQQVLFAHETDSFDAGQHTWTIQIPNCYFQADLVYADQVYGDYITHLSATNLYGSLKVVGLNGGSQACGGQGGGEEDHTMVTLCHATGSTTNPYVKITVDAAGAYNGHYKQHENDIIPPFTYQDHQYSLNWTVSGQAIYNNNCVVPGGMGGGEKDCDGDFDNSPQTDCIQPSKDCDNDFDNSPASECQSPQPQKDCDNDFDNSPASECTTTGGMGGGLGGGTTPTATSETASVSSTTTTPATTASGGLGAGAGVSAAPVGAVNAGGGTQVLSLGSLIGLLSSIGGLGFGVRRLLNQA